MTDPVVSTLEQIGPCVSSELVAALVHNLKLTPAAARQRVSRSTAVKKLAHITFPRRARFVYLQDDYASPRFWDALVRCLIVHSISYGGGLAALMARGGLMPVSHFAIACGAPIAQKRHVSASAVLKKLKAANLIQTFQAQGIGECVELAQKTAVQRSELAEMRARLNAEGLLLCAIKDWARNLGLVSYNTVTLRDQDGKQPRVSTFNWDFAAPSYLGPLTQWAAGKPKPGFIVCDVLLGVNITVEALQPFVHKCSTLRNLPKVGRCLQIFVADGFEREALGYAKSAGVVPATTATLFGFEVAQALRQLADMLKDAYPREGTVEKIDQVFNSLSHIEGAANNLRGALFEFLVAEVARLTNAHTSVQLNEILRDDQGNSAEIDVLVCHANNSVKFIECKGYKPGGTIPNEMVARWLENRIPLIFKVAAADRAWRRCTLHFEFWTSGQLSPEARTMVQAAARNARKLQLKVVEGSEVASIVTSTNNSALKQTYGQHFLGHPLAGSAAKRPKRRLPIPPGAKLIKRGAPDTDSDVELTQ